MIERTESMAAGGRRRTARSRYLAAGETSQKTMLILAAVGLAAAIGITVYSITRQGKTDQFYNDVHLKCTACGDEFVMTAAEVARVRGAAGDPTKKMACPKCKKETGEEMTPCEKCGKWFLPGAMGKDTPMQCPHCKFNPDAG